LYFFSNEYNSLLTILFGGVGVLFFATLSGEIAASLLNTNQPQEGYDLFDQAHICSYPKYTEMYLVSQGLNGHQTKFQGSFETCLGHLNRGEVNAVFFDVPTMQASVKLGQLSFDSSLISFEKTEDLDLAWAFPDPRLGQVSEYVTKHDLSFHIRR
jgi:hypothetical protein